MDCSDLTTDDFRQIQETVRDYLRYLGGLRDRMAAKGFPEHDPLVRDVGDALDAGRTFYLQLDRLAGGLERFVA